MIADPHTGARVAKDPMEYTHPSFVRGREDKWPLIVRKTNSAALTQLAAQRRIKSPRAASKRASDGFKSISKSDGTPASAGGSTPSSLTMDSGSMSTGAGKSAARRHVAPHASEAGLKRARVSTAVDMADMQAVHALRGVQKSGTAVQTPDTTTPASQAAWATGGNARTVRMGYPKTVDEVVTVWKLPRSSVEMPAIPDGHMLHFVPVLVGPTGSAQVQPDLKLPPLLSEICQGKRPDAYQLTASEPVSQPMASVSSNPGPQAKASSAGEYSTETVGTGAPVSTGVAPASTQPQTSSRSGSGNSLMPHVMTTAQGGASPGLHVDDAASRYGMGMVSSSLSIRVPHGQTARASRGPSNMHSMSALATPATHTLSAMTMGAMNPFGPTHLRQQSFMGTPRQFSFTGMYEDSGISMFSPNDAELHGAGAGLGAGNSDPPLGGESARMLGRGTSEEEQPDVVAALQQLGSHSGSDHNVAVSRAVPA